MNSSEILTGMALGFFSGFFLMYSLQFQRPYPNFILDILYHPYIIVLMLVCIGLIFTIDDRLGTLLLLIVTIFVIDVYLLGKNNVKAEDEKVNKIS